MPASRPALPDQSAASSRPSTAWRSPLGAARRPDSNTCSNAVRTKPRC
jgi:hypothetical protein